MCVCLYIYNQMEIVLGRIHKERMHKLGARAPELIRDFHAQNSLSHVQCHRHLYEQKSIFVIYRTGGLGYAKTYKGPSLEPPTQ